VAKPTKRKFLESIIRTDINNAEYGADACRRPMRLSYSEQRRMNDGEARSGVGLLSATLTKERLEEIAL